MNMAMIANRIDKLSQTFLSGRLVKALFQQRVLIGAEHRHLLDATLATVIDIGANRGQFSLAARRWAPGARVFAFEPLSVPAEVFRKVFAGDARVRLYQAAIGPQAGEAVIHVSAADDSSSLLPISGLQGRIFPGTGEAATEKIRVGRLSDFVSAEDIKAPAMLKLDVQGFELEALRGCEVLLGRFSLVYVECSFIPLYTGQALADEVIAWLREKGFQLVGVYHMSYDTKGRAVQGDSCFIMIAVRAVMEKVKTEKILGVSFFNGSTHEAVEKIKSGGYMVVPSAPGLVTMPHDLRYKEALIKSEMAIADSRYMVMLWFLFRGGRVKRISGLTFLLEFLKLSDLKMPGSLFLVNPDDSEATANRDYLETRGICVSDDFAYIAPMYGAMIEDPSLAAILERLKPRYVLLNIGGGQQEKLALYLREHLSYNPSIICTGAAIAFLTGKQARIPSFIDRIGFGWLWRCFQNPRKFIPRYLSAFPLALLIIRYGSSLPPSRS